MVTPNPADILNDSLSDVTRREKRNLLVSSIVGILVSKGGLVPSKFAALGVELSTPEQNVFVILAMGIVLYFLVAFLIYGFADYLMWRSRYQSYIENIEFEGQNWSYEDEMERRRFLGNLPSIGWLYQVSPLTAFARVIFDLFVPVLVSVYCVSSLIIQVVSP